MIFIQNNDYGYDFANDNDDNRWNDMCGEKNTEKNMSNDDDDDHKDDDDDHDHDDLLIMTVIYFRSLFSHKCDFLQLRPNWSTL